MSVNKVILVGNVGKEPDVRHLDRNVVVANLLRVKSEQIPTRTRTEYAVTEQKSLQRQWRCFRQGLPAWLLLLMFPVKEMLSN